MRERDEIQVMRRSYKKWIVEKPLKRQIVVNYKDKLLVNIMQKLLFNQRLSEKASPRVALS